MTVDQARLIKSWIAGGVTLALAFIYIDDGIFPFVILFIGGSLTKTLRKGFDPETDHWIPALSGGMQLAVASYYVILALGTVLLVAKNPKAIDSESRSEFAVFFVAISFPLLIVLLKRDIERFIGSKNNET